MLVPHVALCKQHGVLLQPCNLLADTVVVCDCVDAHDVDALPPGRTLDTREMGRVQAEDALRAGACAGGGRQDAGAVGSNL